MFSKKMIAIAYALSGLSFSYGSLVMAQDRSNIQDNLQGKTQGKVQDKLSDSCQSDISRFCKDVTPGEGRTMACLKAHDDKLSQECKNEWSKTTSQIKQSMKDFHAACKDDVRNFCSDATGPKELVSCLDTHSTDLSGSCKDFRKTHPMMGMMDHKDKDMGMTERTERTTEEHEEKTSS